MKVSAKYPFVSFDVSVAKCTAPKIPNGETNDAATYQENQELVFHCDDGYISLTRPTCTNINNRAEWIPTPECESELLLTNLPLEPCLLLGLQYCPATHQS